MKIMFQLTSVLAALVFLQSILVDAKTDESLQMKVFDHSFRASDAEMHKMLDKANLTGHGYKKEVTTKLVRNEDSGKTDYQKSYFYYKKVDCSKIQEVEDELNNLLPGVLGKELNLRFNKEVKYRHITNMRKCKVGLEVHFKESEGCYNIQTSVSKRRKRKARCGWCFICFSVQGR